MKHSTLAAKSAVGLEVDDPVRPRRWLGAVVDGPLEDRVLLKGTETAWEDEALGFVASERLLLDPEHGSIRTSRLLNLWGKLLRCTSNVCQRLP